jgi:hypothetical protein
MLLIVWNLPQFDFGEFSHHPLEINTPTILNGPTRRNPAYLNQVSVAARQLVHLYLSTDQETFDSGTCGQWDWNVRECHHAQSAVLDNWSVAHWPRTHWMFFHLFRLCSALFSALVIVLNDSPRERTGKLETCTILKEDSSLVCV